MACKRIDAQMEKTTHPKPLKTIRIPWGFHYTGLPSRRVPDPKKQQRKTIGNPLGLLGFLKCMVGIDIGLHMGKAELAKPFENH